MQPIINREDQGECFTRDNRLVTIRLDLPQLSVHEIEFDDTFEVSEHTHSHVDAMYVLEGTVRYLCGDSTFLAGPHTLVAAPAGTPHGFRSAGPAGARVLVFHAPDGGFADLIRNT